MTTFDKSDVRHQPAYSLAEAARYLKLPQATLRAWVIGRDYPVTEGQGRFRALIKPARGKPPLLSFYNLIEAHVLRALRTEHGVSIKALRDAIAYAERTLKLERLLLQEDLRTHGASHWIEPLAARHGRAVEWRAMLLGATFKAAELRPPASYPVKGASMLRDFARSAAWSDERWKKRLIDVNEGAVKRGIFGAPTIVVDGEPFWGDDRRDQIERWLTRGPF